MHSYFLLTIPFVKESKEKTIPLKLSLENPSIEHLELTKNILLKILKEQYIFEKLEDSLLKDYFAFYPYARIILSIINKSKYYEKFSNFYYNLVKQNIKNKQIMYLDFLQINYSLEKEYYSIYYKDYIFAKIKTGKEKLVNKPLKKGLVWLKESQLEDFIARYVATKVIEGLPLNTKGISTEFKKIAEVIKKIEVKNKKKINIKDKKICFDCFPNCLSNILNELLSGGKPNHMERYYLATFLFAIGMEFDKILEIYSHAADYKEDITKYQLKKIKGYAPPSFETLRSMGLCQDEEYDKYKNTVEYYWKKVRENAKNKKE